MRAIETYYKGELVKTLVSEIDFEYLSQFKWYCDREGYIRRAVYTNGEQQVLLMHRVIAGRMGIDIGGYQVDHINRVRHDNRRRNIRAATHIQNSHNRSARSRGTATGHRNVTLERGRYTVRLVSRNKRYYLGSYESIDDAVFVADKARKQLHERVPESR